MLDCRLFVGRLSFGRAVFPGRLWFGLLLGEFIGALFGVLFRALLFDAFPRAGGVNGRKPPFAFAFPFGVDGLEARFPGVAGPRASRGEIAGS